MGLIEKELLWCWERWRWEGVYSRMEANDQALDVSITLSTMRCLHPATSMRICIAGEIKLDPDQGIAVALTTSYSGTYYVTGITS